MTQQPNNTDAVLGNQNLSNSLVLGGIEGLRQRFKLASTDQKIDLLIDTLNYDATGTDLLIDLLNDAELKVRITAYELLALIGSEKANAAIAPGIRLNPGDRIYHVYESIIGYDDCWYYLIDSLDATNEFELAEWGSPKIVSSHLRKENAEAEALMRHRKLMQDWDLSDFGYRSGSYREGFEFDQWLREYQIFDRQPHETVMDFLERLRKIFEATKRTDLLNQLWQNYQKPDFNIDTWFRSLNFTEQQFDESYSEFKQRIAKMLKGCQFDQQLGQLWIETVGRFAFVHEEMIVETKHIDISKFHL